MNLQVIATAHNGFSDKFGIPRQSQETSSIETRIVFEPTFRDENMLRGIEGFSHLWLIWEFSQATGDGQQATGDRQWKATVRPPRLGGNTRVGVFATRSPFRPNRLGLSSVELVRVEKTATEGTVLIVRGADLLNGTPIYDIKPYLSYSDSHPDARNGFGEETRDYRLKVEWGNRQQATGDRRQATGNRQQATGNRQQATGDRRQATGNRQQATGNGQQATGREVPYSQIEEILSQDPRPAYQSDPERIYKLDYAGWKVSFRVEGDTVYVIKIAQR